LIVHHLLLVVITKPVESKDDLEVLGLDVFVYLGLLGIAQNVGEWLNNMTIIARRDDEMRSVEDNDAIYAVVTHKHGILWRLEVLTATMPAHSVISASRAV
jgi:hypothetical protein